MFFHLIIFAGMIVICHISSSYSMTKLFSALSILLVFTGCYRMRASNGGGQIGKVPQRIIQVQDVAITNGYKIEAVASGLTFPTAVTFDDAGNLFVIEAGYSYGEVFSEPKLLQIGSNGQPTLVAKGEKNGPWTGVTWHNGAFYVAEGGELEGGKILKITKDGKITSLISDLPSTGDHHTNGPAIHDGYIYFGIGTATNAGVVGEDNAEFGWLLRRKNFHDIPCKDIILAGENYQSPDVVNKSATAVSTGAYVPFGTSTSAGQVIKGQSPCTGSVMRIPLNGGTPELVAWGFRNPFGLAFSPGGKLYVTDNAFDNRGSRSVWGAADVLWEVNNGSWYGWPDFSAGKPIANDEEFKTPGKDRVKSLFQQYPGKPPAAIAQFGVHSSSNGLDFSSSDAFGFKGQAFVAQFGDMAPNVGKVLAPVGYKVVRVDVEKGIIRDFAANKGKKNGPASWLGKGGLERPVSVKFNATGETMYIVDFGILKMARKGEEPQMNTGVIWKITKS